MNFSISVKLDLPIVNLIQITVYKYAKEGKCSCNTLKSHKRNWSIINTITLYPHAMHLHKLMVPAYIPPDLKPDYTGKGGARGIRQKNLQK
jgi:hypothetical protein